MNSVREKPGSCGQDRFQVFGFEMSCIDFWLILKSLFRRHTQFLDSLGQRVLLKILRRFPRVPEPIYISIY